MEKGSVFILLRINYNTTFLSISTCRTRAQVCRFQFSFEFYDTPNYAYVLQSYLTPKHPIAVLINAYHRPSAFLLSAVIIAHLLHSTVRHAAATSVLSLSASMFLFLSASFAPSAGAINPRYGLYQSSLSPEVIYLRVLFGQNDKKTMGRDLS